ncbi:hypothetical protein [Magnetospira sp. QH-2]|uniref:hypothetical protein n=1 Tax=Magnetospira sp. (strain QH-2) TaxID=1288970 RepID=UPI0003E8149C|nr:hypothetical protein [Magnetospira sp. QH-2]CCQ75093.1 exported protein of unknown function [Magnetospira sp. QH-2]
MKSVSKLSLLALTMIAALAPGLVFGMLSPDSYSRLMEDAEFHLQVQVLSVTRPDHEVKREELLRMAKAEPKQVPAKLIPVLDALQSGEGLPSAMASWDPMERERWLDVLNARKGRCVVSGVVRRLFRNAGETLKLGESIRFRVPCAKREATAMPGPTLWLNMEQLQRARYIETFLNEADGDGFHDVAAHGAGTELIETLTSTPYRSLSD